MRTRICAIWTRMSSFLNKNNWFGNCFMVSWSLLQLKSRETFANALMIPQPFPKVPYLNESGGNCKPAPCRPATGAGEPCCRHDSKMAVSPFTNTRINKYLSDILCNKSQAAAWTSFHVVVSNRISRCWAGLQFTQGCRCVHGYARAPPSVQIQELQLF